MSASSTKSCESSSVRGIVATKSLAMTGWGKVASAAQSAACARYRIATAKSVVLNETDVCW